MMSTVENQSTLKPADVWNRSVVKKDDRWIVLQYHCRRTTSSRKASTNLTPQCSALSSSSQSEAKESEANARIGRVVFLLYPTTYPAAMLKQGKRHLVTASHPDVRSQLSYNSSMPMILSTKGVSTNEAVESDKIS